MYKAKMFPNLDRDFQNAQDKQDFSPDVQCNHFSIFNRYW